MSRGPPPGAVGGPPPSSMRHHGPARTALSHVLSTSAACHLLGQDDVRLVVRAFLRYVASAGASSASSSSVAGMGSTAGGGGGGRPQAGAPQDAGGGEALGPDDPAAPFPRSAFPTDVLDAAEGDEEAEWITHLGRALFYDFEAAAAAHRSKHADTDDAAEGGGGEDRAPPPPPPPPPSVALAWRRMLSPGSPAFPVLGLDKNASMRLGTLMPATAVPHVGPGGHLALMECIFHAISCVPPGRAADGGGAAGVQRAGMAQRGLSTRELKTRVEQSMNAPAGARGPAGPIGGGVGVVGRAYVLLPDLLVYYAICRRYRSSAAARPGLPSKPIAEDGDGSGPDATTREKVALMGMSLLAFRVYDGYQKRGVLVRDTVHRFFADVHGEDSYRRPAIRRVLDAIFTVDEYGGGAQSVDDGAGSRRHIVNSRSGATASTSQSTRSFSTRSISSSGGGSSDASSGVSGPPGSFPARSLTHLKPSDFARGISATVSTLPASGHTAHVLLDWIASLGNAMLPANLFPPVGSPSMLRWVRDKRDMILDADPDRAVGGLCRKYGLGQADLYEVRRRFRSVVEAGAAEKKGDDEGETGQSKDEEDDDRDPDEEGHHLPIDEAEGEPGAAAAATPSSDSASAPGDGKGGKLLRNAIHVDAFVRAASQPDPEMGHGGFLTPALARLTFVGGWIVGNRRRGGGGAVSSSGARGFGANVTAAAAAEGKGGNNGSSGPQYWTLFDALGFGCRAVRGERDASVAPPSFGAGFVRPTRDDAERSLLKFVFATFLMLPTEDDDDDDDDDDASSVDSISITSSMTASQMALSRTQVGHMLVMLLEHAAFRLRVDSPPAPPLEDETEREDEERREREEREKKKEEGRNEDGGSEGEGGSENGSEYDSDEYDSEYSSEDSDVALERKDRRRRRQVVEDEIYLRSLRESTGGRGSMGLAAGESIRTMTVDATNVSLLGMLPPNLADDAITDEGRVKLDTLINYVLDESIPPPPAMLSTSFDDNNSTGMPPRPRPRALTYQGFLNWHYSAGAPGSAAAGLPTSQRRIGPYLLDLRLLGGILFGVKPSDPEVEKTLADEVMRRHKYRYPQADGSRRGPAGTVWYVINVRWWRRWNGWAGGRGPAGSATEGGRQRTLSNASNGEILAALDGGGKDGHADENDAAVNDGPPPPGRIDNDALLSPGGSLALRPGLKWRRDFELLPPLAWSALQAWHDGGPPIHRTVVAYHPSGGGGVAGGAGVGGMASPGGRPGVGGGTAYPGHPTPRGGLGSSGGFAGMTSPGKSSGGGRSALGGSATSASGADPTLQNEIELYPLFVSVMLCDGAAPPGGIKPSTSASTVGSPGYAAPVRPFQQSVPLSRHRPVRDLLEDLCRSLDISTRDARLWMTGASAVTLRLAHDPNADPGDTQDFVLYLSNGLEEQLRKRGVSVDPSPAAAAPIADGGDGASGGGSSGVVLILELRNESGSWPKGIRNNLMERGPSSRADLLNSKKDDGTPVGDGIVGLYNMGNSCYLNASIQCLSHTPILRDYFTSKAYLNDINTTNPLGQQGRLAQVTAVLVNELWKRSSQGHQQQSNAIGFPKKAPPNSAGGYTPIQAPALTPKSFKEAIAKFNEHFAGNEQHDAQELLSFLLSGLSEDLNRIVDKPYIEAPDSDGRPDRELADIWWSNHLKREMSIVVALFTGQYKSLLTCRTCKYESARFEPFAFLQLPLPEDDQVSVQLLLYPLGGSTKNGEAEQSDGGRRASPSRRASMKEEEDLGVPTKYIVRVRHDGTLFDVLTSLSKVLHADMVEEGTIEDVPPDADDGNDSHRPESSPTKVEATAANEDDDADAATPDAGDGADTNTAPKGDDDKNNDDESENDMPTERERRRKRIYMKMAQNMAVVRMREGYIFNIVPNMWSLAKMQNRETGELDLLHVYDLEPLPVTASDEAEKTGEEKKKVEGDVASTGGDNDETVESPISDDAADNGDRSDGNSTVESEEEEEEEEDPSESDSGADKASLSVAPSAEATAAEDKEKSTTATTQPEVKYSYLAIAQRKLDLVSRPLLHPYCHGVFGTPLLLRVIDLEGYTGRDLYDLIAERIRRFVPKSAWSILLRGRDVPSEDAMLEGAMGESSASVDASASAAAEPRKLKAGGSRQQRRRTAADAEEASAGRLPRYGFRLRISSRDGRRCSLCPWYECCVGCLIPDDDYPTIVMCGDSVALDWHMSVDLKTAGFGLKVADAKISASSSSGGGGGEANPPKTLPRGVKKHKTCSAGRNKYGYSGCLTLEECLDAFSKEEKIPEAYCSRCKESRVQTKRMSLWRLPPVMMIHLKRFQFTQHMKRKLRDLVYFPTEGLDFSRIVACEESAKAQKVGKVETETTASADGEGQGGGDADSSNEGKIGLSAHEDGRSEPLYDLYAVVHHQGALSGGHYVASLKSDADGKWRLFNDAAIYEVSARDVVDSSAYILFYVRRDVKTCSLGDFWDTTQREGEGLTEEEVEKLMKHRERCVIS